MASTDRERKIYTSDICIDGKRITAMREISEAAFGDSFLFIKVYEGRFVVTVDDRIDINSFYKFTEKYKLCKVKIYREVDVNHLKNSKK